MTAGVTATIISTTQLDLTWTATPNATKYNLFDGTTKIGVDIAATNYSHTGVSENYVHRHTINACDATGCSSAKAGVTVTTRIGNFIRTFSTTGQHTEYVNIVAISPKGIKVASGSSDKTSKLW